jgi:hypothetical protein
VDADADLQRCRIQKAVWFSSKLLLPVLYATVVNNLYSILIGKIFAPKDLDFILKQKNILNFYPRRYTLFCKGFLFQFLASLQADQNRMVSVYSRMMGMVVFLLFRPWHCLRFYVNHLSVFF